MTGGAERSGDLYTYRDPATGRDTGVLINKLDVRDANAWTEIERRKTSQAASEIEYDGRVFAISPQGFRDTHKALFGELYTWAGQDRTMPMGIAGTGVRFAEPQYIATELDKRFRALDRSSNDAAGNGRFWVGHRRK
jgi:cell filamentation protein